MADCMTDSAQNYMVDSALSFIRRITHFQSYSQFSLSFMKQRTEQSIGDKWNNIYLFLKHEPLLDKTNKITCVHSKESDQPGHLPRLI